MTTIDNFGNTFLNYIDNDKKTSKEKVILELEKYKNDLQSVIDKDIENKTKYIIDYENPRNEQDALYNTYYTEREIIYNEWLHKKTANLLYDLVHIKKPEFKNIPHIYTHNYIKRKQRLFGEQKLKKENIISMKPKKVKETKAPKVKEPKVKEPKEPKEPKVKEPKVTKEPKVKEPKEPKVKKPKEPKVKEPKEPKETIIIEEEPIKEEPIKEELIKEEPIKEEPIIDEPIIEEVPKIEEPKVKKAKEAKEPKEPKVKKAKDPKK